MRVPDSYDLWEQKDNNYGKWLEHRPKCIFCGEYIQEDSVVQIRGDYYCDRCLDDMRVYIDN